MPEEFENASINGHFEFVLQREAWTGKSHYYCDVIFEKLSFQIAKLAFSNSSGLKSVKLCQWTVVLKQL